METKMVDKKHEILKMHTGNYFIDNVPNDIYLHLLNAMDEYAKAFPINLIGSSVRTNDGIGQITDIPFYNILEIRIDGGLGLYPLNQVLQIIPNDD